MTTLLLIRHGQASLGAADYDVLSPLGELQARRLGAHLGASLAPPDRIITGPRKRQRDTATLLVAAARQRGAPYPDPTVALEFDEYPAQRVMQRHLPRFAADDPELGRHFADLQRHPPATREHRRAFEAVFQRMMRHWHDDDLGDPDIETSHAFQERVGHGLRELLQPRGHTTLVVTSAGPVGVGLRLGLATDLWSAIRASFVVHNSALTELQSRGAAPMLTMFNAVPHLPDRAEITLR